MKNDLNTAKTAFTKVQKRISLTNDTGTELQNLVTEASKVLPFSDQRGQRRFQLRWRTIRIYKSALHASRSDMQTGQFPSKR